MLLQGIVSSIPSGDPDGDPHGQDVGHLRALGAEEAVVEPNVDEEPTGWQGGRWLSKKWQFERENPLESRMMSC